MDEFFADGGTTSFVDRVAGALGIHASTIKVVAVYKGSVIIDFYIMAEEDDDNATQTLKKLGKSFASKMESGALDLGAPVLSAGSDGESFSVPFVARTDRSRNSNSSNRSSRGGSPNRDSTGASKRERSKPEPSIAKADDEEIWEGDALLEPVIGANKAEEAETDEAAGVKYPILIICLVVAILIAVVAIILVRVCIVKTQNPRLAEVKAEVDRQCAGTESQFHPGQNAQNIDNEIDIFAPNMTAGKRNEDDIGVTYGGQVPQMSAPVDGKGEMSQKQLKGKKLIARKREAPTTESKLVKGGST